VTTKLELYERGKERIELFCRKNGLTQVATVLVNSKDWYFDCCAYYRKDTVTICLAKCGFPCGPTNSANWTWPGSVIDREPFGVLAHELGHHVDLCIGKVKDRYSSEVSGMLRRASGEQPLTGYCPNDAEWFAEMMRLFITNSQLLKVVRPTTYSLFLERWNPVSKKPWLDVLGSNCPARVINSIHSRIRRL